MPQHGTGQRDALDVGAEAHQILDAVTVIYPYDVLLDNRPVVEFFGHVVSGSADELDPALLGPPVWALRR